ncbi:lycopene cyclase [Frankia sp. R43]|uniref:lycopene cyclase domain-containing protein n=1 Tax=Frankia sp. R43 TaxID=269536 RepID=UPI0006CA28EB|nr:lycopene cyclase domain-containing protein [Frankia sp. R43]KPM54667.1 lycopene cyclase [Frankia sp. R43]
MGHLSYLAVLLGCLVATAPLELLLRTRVYARPRRLALAIAPVLVVFVGWDLYAIARGHWDFDPRRTTGIVLPGGLPLDEVLFFVVVPVCAVLALEAVRAVTRWPAGDEGDGRGPGQAGHPRGRHPRGRR